MALLLAMIGAAASFFFAVAETSLLSMVQGHKKRSAAAVEPKTKALDRLLEHPDDMLATIVLGNTLANAGIVAVGFWLSFYDGWPMAATLGVALALILVGCEVIPKTLAVRRPEKWSLRVAPVMEVILRLTLPLRRFAQAMNQIILKIAASRSIKPQAGLAEGEYQELLEMAFQQGTLARSEKEIILQIISLDRRIVRDVMRPRSQMACISDDLSIEEMVAAARKYKHRRLPLYDEATDSIVSILNTRALLLDPNADLVDAIEFPSFVPDGMNLLQLFRSLQRQQRGMAIVLDEFGGTAGVVTMEDILEEVIGEIRSEGGETGFVMEKLGPGRWRVDGAMPIEDFRREFPALEAVEDVETMGGLMCALKERIPATGEMVQFQGLRLKVLSGDERRVREILVEVQKRRGA